jgi:hypothetical protein
MAATPAHCGVDEVQRQAATTKVEASTQREVESIPELSAGRAKEQPARSGDEGEETIQLAGGSAVRVGAALLTSGTVIWLLHSNYWAYLLIFGLPLWRDVDLLPIVARETGGGGIPPSRPTSTEEERAVTRVFDGPISSLDVPARRS